MDKLEAMSMTAFPLPWYRVIALEGADAEKFAQAQLMSDIGALADGHWHWSGWLTPRGRVIALCAALRFDSGLLWLLLQDADADAFAARLQRFVFRSKVDIRVCNGLAAFGAFAAAGAEATGSTIHGNATGTVTLDLGVPGTPRVLTLAGNDSALAAGQVPADIDVRQQRWLGVDLAHGLPHLGSDTPELWTPQQLSLDRLRAYSVSKGCYPGQEIVARTHFLGKAKRELVLLHADAGLVEGADVTHAGRSIGTLACVNREPSSGGTVALAVLSAELADDAVLEVSGQPAVRRPMQAGLAR